MCVELLHIIDWPSVAQQRHLFEPCRRKLLYHWNARGLLFGWCSYRSKCLLSSHPFCFVLHSFLSLLPSTSSPLPFSSLCPFPLPSPFSAFPFPPSHPFSLLTFFLPPQVPAPPPISHPLAQILPAQSLIEVLKNEVSHTPPECLHQYLNVYGIVEWGGR